MATNQTLSHLLTGRKVESVRQRGAELDIDFADGSTLSLTLASATGAVKLTDDDDKVEFEEKPEQKS